jgi:hypothetical protein
VTTPPFAPAAHHSARVTTTDERGSETNRKNRADSPGLAQFEGLPSPAVAGQIGAF